MITTKSLESQFRNYQTVLLPFAYNILGTSMEAEDIVQEVLHNYFLSATDHIQNPKFYLIRSVINRAITEKKRIQLLKRKYIGEWLPVPVSPEERIYKLADQSQIVNYSLLVLLERLNPKERAVFILKETFDFSHKEVAEVLETTVENSRQLYKRAQQKLEPDIHRSFNTREQSNTIIEKLTVAILEADVEQVKRLLAEDVRSISDGGGKIQAARKILVGRESVSKFLQAIYGKYHPEGTESQLTEINHKPAILFKLGGRVFRCIILEINKDVVENIFIIVNPEKLRSF
ncbi:MAG TPA: sigma-70 family RNA polymerase sigma factor [Cyclobacteriaceae bacterium]|nr:sigma-70 family RNA polymerase sigma factor [Cyclobacteriaceae bacterium]